MATMATMATMDAMDKSQEATGTGFSTPPSEHSSNARDEQCTKRS